jgi:hypothetical protein
LVAHAAFVVAPRVDDDGDATTDRRVQRPEGLDALAIGKVEVQEDRVDGLVAALVEVLERGLHVAGQAAFGDAPVLHLNEVAEQNGVGLAVVDDEESEHVSGRRDDGILNPPMPLPIPAFDTAPEPFATDWGETQCDLREDRPGVTSFRDFVLRHQGGGYGSIGRPCGATGARSGHYSGRAWDWAVRADDPEERAAADELIGWLLANDGEMFRRAGLVYLIWNKRSWNGTRGWKLYDGWAEDGTCSTPPCRNPHTDHVHFSFSVPGADGLTSFYPWLAGTQPTVPLNVPPTPNPHFPLRRASAAPLLLGIAAGAGAAWGAQRYLIPRLRRS